MNKNYPDIIPVFPLNGVIYFPKTNLPLNIFEQRYLDLINDAYNKNKLMGMVQTKKEDDNIYRVIFEAEPISKEQRQAGYGGIDRYVKLEGYNNSDLIKRSSESVKGCFNKIKTSLRSDQDEVAF